ncbi:hypothetical protein [Micromonospora sp. NPDC093277]
MESGNCSPDPRPPGPPGAGGKPTALLVAFEAGGSALARQLPLA